MIHKQKSLVFYHLASGLKTYYLASCLQALRFILRICNHFYSKKLFYYSLLIHLGFLKLYEVLRKGCAIFFHYYHYFFLKYLYGIVLAFISRIIYIDYLYTSLVVFSKHRLNILYMVVTYCKFFLITTTWNILPFSIFVNYLTVQIFK